MKLTRIPKNIFQTWTGANLSDGLIELTDTWKTKNVNYCHFVFDDIKCQQFISKFFGDNVLNAYNRLVPGAYKADLWRYCILYIYGGIYIDIDTICITPIDLFINDSIEFMTVVDLNNSKTLGNHNIFSGFIASVPNHPILLDSINRILINIGDPIIPLSNLDLTGPGVLGRAINKHFGNNETESFVGKEGMVNNIKLLKFIPITEYVIDIETGYTLLQNKNGNPYIEKIYKEATKNIKYIDWGTCINPVKPDNNINTNVTIVTMIYDIRKKERENYGLQVTSNKIRTMEQYLELSKKFILKLNYNLIIFADDDDIINFINEENICTKKL